MHTPKYIYTTTSSQEGYGTLCQSGHMQLGGVNRFRFPSIQTVILTHVVIQYDNYLLQSFSITNTSIATCRLAVVLQDLTSSAPLKGSNTNRVHCRTLAFLPKYHVVDDILDCLRHRATIWSSLLRQSIMVYYQYFSKNAKYKLTPTLHRYPCVPAGLSYAEA